MCLFRQDGYYLPKIFMTRSVSEFSDFRIFVYREQCVMKSSPNMILVCFLFTLHACLKAIFCDSVSRLSRLVEIYSMRSDVEFFTSDVLCIFEIFQTE